MATPDLTAEWWTTSEVAAYLGLRVGTVSSYRQRDQMPAPDKTLGRTHLWRPATITNWQAHRPRVGDESAPQEQAGATTEEHNTQWDIHGERTLYDSQWVRLSLVDVELPDGQRFEHHVVTMAPAAIVAVVDGHDRVLLMWRHRFASDTWNWELPGGIVDSGEEPAAAAHREIEEETGYQVGRLEHIVTFEPMIGMVRSAHHVFVGREPVQVGEPTETTEMQRMEWIRLDAVPQLIADGQICGSGTLVGLLHLLTLRQP
jgi:8-oxo-dGTP pyrophosphatase MutT (NUDIX family)